MAPQNSRFIRFSAACLCGLLCLFVLGFVSNAAAEEKVEDLTVEKGKPERVKTGTIAGTSRVGGGDRSIDVQTNDNAPGDPKNVISGSVSVTGRNECTAAVLNGSKKNSYKVRFKVQGTNKRDRVVLNKTYSARIAPEGKTTRTFRCNPDLFLTVVLTSADKLDK